MAFALTKFRAYGQLPDGASTRRRQMAELTITAAAADVDLDISDSGGTFWTAALADSDYGDLAQSALTFLTNIAGASEGLIAVDSEDLLGRVKVASVSGAGQYELAVNSKLPDLTYNAGDGPTSQTLVLEWALNDSQMPQTF